MITDPHASPHPLRIASAAPNQSVACSAGWLAGCRLASHLTESLFTSCQNSIFLSQQSAGTVFFSPAEQKWMLSFPYSNNCYSINYLDVAWKRSNYGSCACQSETSTLVNLGLVFLQVPCNLIYNSTCQRVWNYVIYNILPKGTDQSITVFRWGSSHPRWPSKKKKKSLHATFFVSSPAIFVLSSALAIYKSAGSRMLYSFPALQLQRSA